MYTQFYGLTARPFENTPDPEFLYLSEQHREVLASLSYCIEYAKGFMLLAGDVGTGKTTVLQGLLRDLPSDTATLHISNPLLINDPFILLDHLAEKLGMSVQGQDGLRAMETVRQGLEKLNGQGRRAVIIVDEAHLLPLESLENLRLLSNIENSKGKLLQIILAAQNEIYPKLEQAPLRPLKQRLTIHRKLEPLSRDEVGAYIEKRLQVAGRQEPLFEALAVHKVAEASQGFPRLINQICDNALLIGFATQKMSITAEIISEVLDDMDMSHGLVKVEEETLPPPVPTPENLQTPPAQRLAPLLALCLVLVVVAYFFWPQNNKTGETGQIIAQQALPPATAPVAVSQPEAQAKSTSTPVLPPEEETPESRDLQQQPPSTQEADQHMIPAENAVAVSAQKENGTEDIDISEPLTTEDQIQQTPQNETPANEPPQPGELTALPAPPPATEVSSRPDPPEIMGELVLQEGESLSRLIARTYGRYRISILNQVLELNPNLTDPDTIMPGSRLALPMPKLPVEGFRNGRYQIILSIEPSLNLAYSLIKNARRQDVILQLMPAWSKEQGFCFLVMQEEAYLSMEAAEAKVRTLPGWLQSSARVMDKIEMTVYPPNYL